MLNKYLLTLSGRPYLFVVVCISTQSRSKTAPDLSWVPPKTVLGFYFLSSKQDRPKCLAKTVKSRRSWFHHRGFHRRRSSIIPLAQTHRNNRSVARLCGAGTRYVKRRHLGARISSFSGHNLLNNAKISLCHGSFLKMRE